MMTPWAPHSRALSMSALHGARERVDPRLQPQPGDLLDRLEVLSETAGIPASIRSTPISASFSAISILSATLITTPGVCSPSRSVASWMLTFARQLVGAPDLGRIVEGTDPPFVVAVILLCSSGMSPAGLFRASTRASTFDYKARRAALLRARQALLGQLPHPIIVPSTRAFSFRKRRPGAGFQPQSGAAMTRDGSTYGSARRCGRRRPAASRPP